MTSSHIIFQLYPTITAQCITNSKCSDAHILPFFISGSEIIRRTQPAQGNNIEMTENHVQHLFRKKYNNKVQRTGKIIRPQPQKVEAEAAMKRIKQAVQRPELLMIIRKKWKILMQCIHDQKGVVPKGFYLHYDCNSFEDEKRRKECPY